MNWFHRLCRNTGLMLHNVAHPDKKAAQKQVVRQEVEEKKVSPSVTLRRTTIEEIEVKGGEEKRRGEEPPPE